MSTVVIMGSQWGDEGKGKIVDYLAEQADGVVRYQGGSNAGHTVVVNDISYKLQLLPSGILYPGKLCIVGNGVVIDPAHIIKEIKGMQEKGIDTSSLRISNRAHVVFPWHMAQDELEEEAKGENKIGTTKKGIGPCYMDKNARVGLRICDLMDAEDFPAALKRALEQKNRYLKEAYGHPGFDYEEILKNYQGYAEFLRSFVTDTSEELNDAIDAGKRIVFEGAQATLLDLDHGTYPYVTSSHPIAGGACIGSGVGPRKIKKVVGVVKAYTTRVGAGPFPTELLDETGDFLRNEGHEYGTVTGRPRRCGWLDAMVVRYAGRVSGMDYLAITRLDILDKLPKIQMCVGYVRNGEVVKGMPASLKELALVEPVYEEFEGWQTTTCGIRKYEDLPEQAKTYLARLAEVAGVPVGIVSIGPGRDQTMVLVDLWN